MIIIKLFHGGNLSTLRSDRTGVGRVREGERGRGGQLGEERERMREGEVPFHTGSRLHYSL